MRCESEWHDGIEEDVNGEIVMGTGNMEYSCGLIQKR